MNSSCTAQQVGWQSGYGEAKARATKESLPILLHFGAWYCGPCQRMERDVFPDAQVQQTLGGEIASVKIDVSHEPDLASQYGASTVPRDVVVFPDGTVETLNVGYMSKTSYISMLRNVISRSQQMGVPKPVEPGSRINPQVAANPTSEASEKTGGVPVATVSEPTVESPMIGLEGYCPVRLHAKREWTPGFDTITSDYRSIRYQFATESDREIFLQNPAEYAPQDLGCDPVLLTADLKAVSGNIRFGAFFDRRLYLFRSIENRDEFKQNPLKYTHIRSALRVDQIEGSQIE